MGAPWVLMSSFRRLAGRGADRGQRRRGREHLLERALPPLPLGLHRAREGEPHRPAVVAVGSAAAWASCWLWRCSPDVDADDVGRLVGAVMLIGVVMVSGGVAVAGLFGFPVIVGAGVLFVIVGACLLL